MNYKSICASALLMTGFLLATTEATAAGPAGNAVADMGGRRDVLSGNTDDAQQQPASGDIAELQQMIRDGKVRELRTTYNGSYGASLLYYPDEMLYYVAMFQQKKFDLIGT